MNKKQSFIKGSAILIGANALSKILGAVFKIPITYILSEEGMAIFNTAMSVYAAALCFVVSGVPLALLRHTASKYALSEYRAAKKGVGISSWLLLSAGFIISLILFFFSDIFAGAMKEPSASFSIKILSFSVFFVAWEMVYKSFFQGTGNMIPTALSQVIEAVLKLVFGFGAAYMLRNAALYIRAAGAISGVTAGEIAAALLLYAMWRSSKKELLGGRISESNREIFMSLMSVAVPLVCFSAMSGALGLLDVSLIRNSLLRIRFTPKTAERFMLCYSSYTSCFDGLFSSLSLSREGARWLYGAYSGYCLTVFHLPCGMIASVGASVLAAMSGALAKKDLISARRIGEDALRLTLFIALPSALVLYMYPDDILRLLFRNTASARLLRLLSPSLLFLCVFELFGVMIHASGNILRPFLYSVSGTLIKLLFDFFLIPDPRFNISGAVIGSDIGYMVSMILCFFGAEKTLGIRIRPVGSLLRCIISAGVMGAVSRMLYVPNNIIFHNSPFAVIVTLMTSGAAYVLMLSVLGERIFAAIVPKKPLYPFRGHKKSC